MSKIIINLDMEKKNISSVEYDENISTIDFINILNQVMIKNIYELNKTASQKIIKPEEKKIITGIN